VSIRDKEASVRRLSTAFALAALGAATVGFAQTAPQTSSEPPASTAPQQQQAPTDPSTDSGSQPRAMADKQSQINDCVSQVKTQVQKSNPSISDDQIKQYCEQQVNQQAPPQG
jgi:hypothetical protein